MAEQRVPKLNNNDTEYVLTEWLVADGAEVRAGDPMVVVETSKAAEELVAEASGVLRQRAKAGDLCRPGELVAEVLDGSAPRSVEPGPAADPAAADGGPLVTRAARELADRYGISAGRIAALGLAVVRGADIEALHAADGSAAGADAAGAETAVRPGAVRLGRVQRGVARSVELSHRTIPAAYTVVRMDLGPAVAHARALTRSVRRPVGLAEVFVQQVAALHPQFPLFFAAIEGSTALLAEAPHIGVTVDLGEGLFVPCVRDAANRTIREIATELMRFRLAATDGTFRESDLGGANFVVTLHTDADVVLAVPLVFPGTVCALAVTSPTDGSPANIGLAYDHRLINGRDAVLFLHALKNSVEGLG
ncbi:2-oxo acid dehydrogenase subunit E2 [Streptacidiphilus sp. P02-A3a]|uniref:2-oxo acid dehydrogenase subunit E2 n=1 Tax=Streptacidiphilus sp. P02-A3a TaxID=2704468 RepID=UPI0015FCA62E|nr:2-oxo acid dehydrogenase subunit E2 [Streptacidiphilus sp. P02-A3a]QMU69855.1 dehydrogenase [Streptacidiphilus sp. P02-A3a]